MLAVSKKAHVVKFSLNWFFSYECIRRSHHCQTLQMRCCCDCLRQDFVVEKLNATIQRLIKRLFLALDHFLDLLLPCADFGKYLSHSLRQHINEFIEKWLMKTERAPIAHGPTQNAPENVPTSFVGGNDAIG